MTIEFFRSFFLWNAIINIAIVTVWFLFFVLAHDFIYGLHKRWFKLSVEKFDGIHYKGMACFKIFIYACNVVPCIVLFILG